MRILVVDDDGPSRHLLSTIASAAGHECETAIDGVDALAKARAVAPDIVISDILMPRMDGYQLVREWKSDVELSCIPVVLCTASYTAPEDERFAHDLGVDGFLSKPVDPSRMYELIARFEGSSARATPRAPRLVDEVEVLKEYNERLVHKLEEKVEELERSITMLGSAIVALERDVETKRRLVDELRVEVEEREKREAELRHERDFSRRVLDTVDVFIVELASDLTITTFNPGAERTTGYRSSDVTGASFAEMFVPADEREVFRAFARAVMEGTRLTGQVGSVLNARRERRLLEWTATRSPEWDGAASGVLMFGVDVTERMISAAADRAMARIDLAVMLGRPRSEILDVACERFVAEFDLLRAVAVMRERDAESQLVTQATCAPPHHLDAGRDRDNHDFDTAFVLDAMKRDVVVVAPAAKRDSACDGKDSPFYESAVFPLRAHARTVGAMVLTSSEPHAFVEYRREALRRLVDRLAIGLAVAEGREQTALQLAALESADSAIIIAAVDGRVLWANRSLTALTGYDMHEVISSNILGGATSGYREPHYAEAWSQVLRGVSWSGGVESHRKDGTPYFEEVTIAGVFNEDGNVAHVVIIKQDVSERRALEQAKSDFVAVLSHELRTPLTSVVGYLDLIGVECMRHTLPEAIETAASRARSSAGTMQSLVDQLLDVAQLRTELFELEMTDMDVGALVVEVLGGVAPTERHEMCVEIEEPTPQVCGDRRRLTKALEAVIDNAIKYSPDGGIVSVRVKRVNDSVLIAVTDSGIGMSEDAAAVVFDPFTQLDMSSTRRFGGMGVGLFLAYGIVTAHGGSISVESKQGRGSTFTLSIPVRARAAGVGDGGV